MQEKQLTRIGRKFAILAVLLAIVSDIAVLLAYLFIPGGLIGMVEGLATFFVFVVPDATNVFLAGIYYILNSELPSRDVSSEMGKLTKIELISLYGGSLILVGSLFLKYLNQVFPLLGGYDYTLFATPDLSRTVAILYMLVIVLNLYRRNRSL